MKRSMQGKELNSKSENSICILIPIEKYIHTLWQRLTTVMWSISLFNISESFWYGKIIIPNTISPIIISKKDILHHCGILSRCLDKRVLGSLPIPIDFFLFCASVFYRLDRFIKISGYIHGWPSSPPIWILLSRELSWRKLHRK